MEGREVGTNRNLGTPKTGIIAMWQWQHFKEGVETDLARISVR